MARGSRKDIRETFVLDSVRLRNKSTKGNKAIRDIQAPSKNAIELYFKEKVLYMMEDNGVETPIGGSSSASSGKLSFTFSFGKQGNVNNAYLLGDSVPSNKSGSPVWINNGKIRKIFVVNSSISTFNVEVQDHTGVADYTTLYTVPVVASRTANADVSVPIVNGKQLAIKITGGASKDPRVFLVGDGTF